MTTVWPTRHDAPMAHTTSSPLRPRHRALATAAALLLVAPLALGACGSDGSDGASDGSTTTSAASGATSGDTGSGDETTTTAAAGGDLDVCAEVPKDKVQEILTGATITKAEAVELGGPNCSYYVATAGTELPVVKITWNEPAFYDAQKQTQTEAVPLEGVEGFQLRRDVTQLVVKGATGAFDITGGVELTEGGQVASIEQLTEIAKLVEGL